MPTATAWELSVNSATFPRSSRITSGRRVRVAATAVSLVGALLLTACSGGSDSDSTSNSNAKDGSSPSASATTGAATGGGTGGADDSASGSGDLKGSWFTTADGKVVVLMVNGKEAGLFVTGGTVCSGTAGEEAGMRMIHLTCPNGSKARVTGMVDAVDGTSLTVTWEGAVGKETYTKAKGGAKLPGGLPTAGLGS
jgi:hypothetical protein